MAVQDTVMQNGMSKVVIKISGKLMPSMPRLYWIGGDVIQAACSTNCIPLDDGSNSHQSGSEQRKVATAKPSASQRADSALTRRQSTAPISGRKTIRLSQGNQLVRNDRSRAHGSGYRIRRRSLTTDEVTIDSLSASRTANTPSK